MLVEFVYLLCLQYKSAKNAAPETTTEKRPTLLHESIDHDYVSKSWDIFERDQS